MKEKVTIEEKLLNVKKKHIVKDPKKLEEQKAYYARLSKSGIAKKQIYNLKAVSAI